MSDTPPDPKEADDAPAAPRNPWVNWLMWAIFVPVLYVLSIGPAGWLARKGYFPEMLGGIYYPLRYLPYDLLELVKRYIEWWVP